MDGEKADKKDKRYAYELDALIAKEEWVFPKRAKQVEDLIRPKMKKILIKVGQINMEAGLNESKTASFVYKHLPIRSKVKLWGEEIYFDVPIKMGLEEGFAKDLVNEGDFGYWPEGPSLCIFFGPTPISKPGEIRPASKINIIGKLLGDPKEFKNVKEGERIVVEKSE